MKLTLPIEGAAFKRQSDPPYFVVVAQTAHTSHAAVQGAAISLAYEIRVMIVTAVHDRVPGRVADSGWRLCKVRPRCGLRGLSGRRLRCGVFVAVCLTIASNIVFKEAAGFSGKLGVEVIHDSGYAELEVVQAILQGYHEGLLLRIRLPVVRAAAIGKRWRLPRTLWRGASGDPIGIIVAIILAMNLLLPRERCARRHIQAAALDTAELATFVDELELVTLDRLRWDRKHVYFGQARANRQQRHDVNSERLGRHMLEHPDGTGIDVPGEVQPRRNDGMHASDAEEHAFHQLCGRQGLAQHEVEAPALRPRRLGAARQVCEGQSGRGVWAATVCKEDIIGPRPHHAEPHDQRLMDKLAMRLANELLSTPVGQALLDAGVQRVRPEGGLVVATGSPEWRKLRPLS